MSPFMFRCPNYRHFRRDLKFYDKQIPSKVALIQDSLAVEVLRSHTTNEVDLIEHKSFYSLSKPVSQSIFQGGEQSIDHQSGTSFGSYPFSNTTLESSDLMSSSTYRSHDHYFSLDFGSSSSKPEKSGQQAFLISRF